ncbi:hypothetical protein TNCV_4432561 [Trichonephila clavipes]|nr:hypothetical protein TNCV_4432561 [Trichonephila clavipes]
MALKRLKPYCSFSVKSCLKIYANLQSPKTPKSINDKVPCRFVTRGLKRVKLLFESVSIENECEEKKKDQEIETSMDATVWQKLQEGSELGRSPI